MQQAEKRYSNGILLRGLGETKEQAKAALKEEKKKYKMALREGLEHLYFKTAVDDKGRDVGVRSSGMVPYRMENGQIGLRMEPNRMVPVLTRKQDVFENTYIKKNIDPVILSAEDEPSESIYQVKDEA